jgi:hypothetical protein
MTKAQYGTGMFLTRCLPEFFQPKIDRRTHAQAPARVGNL